jgi:hypothetical protein
MSSELSSSQGIALMKYAQTLEPSRVPYYKHSFGTSNKGKKEVTKQALKDAMIEDIENDSNRNFESLSASAIETGCARIFIDSVSAIEQAAEDHENLKAVNFFDILKISYKTKTGKNKKDQDDRRQEVEIFNNTALPIVSDIASAKEIHYQRLKENEKRRREKYMVELQRGASILGKSVGEEKERKVILIDILYMMLLVLQYMYNITIFKSAS